MSISAEDPTSAEAPVMSAYEEQVWNALHAHWEGRANKRGLPNWANSAISRTGEFAGGTARRVVGAMPNAVVEPVQRAGAAVGDKALGPALRSAAGLLELTNDWAMELNDPKGVEQLARKRGLELESFSDLKYDDLKFCDRLLTFNNLKWRTFGALEGGAMGVLALVPVAGIPAAITADILVVQVLSTAIASRIAYSYGFDAKDPAEAEFIQRLVQRSFMAQAAKAQPMHQVAAANQALKGRVNWSNKLRADHRLVAAMEKLLKQIGPAGARVPVKHVAKVVPFVGILVGAGANSVVLGNVAADAQRYCQTRFLCEKYGLPMPVALAGEPNELVESSPTDG